MHYTVVHLQGDWLQILRASVKLFPSRSQFHNRDPAIAFSQIPVLLQFLLGAHNLPCPLIRLRPVLSEDEAANLSPLTHLTQAVLNRNSNLATRARRTIAMNQLEEAAAFGPRHHQFTLH